MTPKIPKGWRRLRKGTLIREGDKCWGEAKWDETILPGARVGSLWMTNPFRIYIRRKAKGRKGTKC